MEIPDKHKAEKALRKMAQPWPSSGVTQQSFVDLVKNNERRFDSEEDHGFGFGGFGFRFVSSPLCVRLCCSEHVFRSHVACFYWVHG